MSLLQRTEVLVQREVEPPFLKAPVPERSGRHEMTDLCFSEDSTWSVLILNDDHTPMEFVVDAIEEFFDMDRESAMRLMLRIHSDGAAECGIYSHEIAKAKAMQVVAFAREHRHPLQCVIERKRKILAVRRLLLCTLAKWRPTPSLSDCWGRPEVIRRPSQRRFSSDLAQAAPSPGCAATPANRAAHAARAATEPEATEPATAATTAAAPATSAANKPATAATTEATAPAATSAAAAPAATSAAAATTASAG
jgi:ATP-dependent Clp protease adapter protein ClpS